ncbi:type III pantothenate kinase [bacterium]|nr:type III pantothenate kinase [bacterium]
MILAIDIGNSNITFGIFDGENLTKKFCLPSNYAVSDFEYGEKIKEQTVGFNISGCVIASVVTGLDLRFKNFLDKQFSLNSLVLTYDLPLGLKIKTDVPAELGADRIANSFGAVELYHENCVIVDFGTATTVEIVTKNKEFIGGLITAGINIQLGALASKTSKLPETKVSAPKKLIATDTVDAMLAGVVYGSAAMAEGIVKRYREALAPDKFVVIATGGLAEFISQYTENLFDYVEPDLTLRGLLKVYEYLNA